MINQEEYEVLRDYYFRGIRWISRNENGNLVVSKIKPDKSERKWLPQCPDEDWSELRNSETYLFLFIQWEDNEPYNIAELIEEYESEEREVKKDLEWLKDEVARIYDTRDYWSVDDLRDEILDWINELDEPEVLSQELPVIPKFVADYIEECKRFDKSGRKSLYAAIDSMPKEVSEWMTFDIEDFGKGQELFARAWLDGFTVEEEPKYYVERIAGGYLEYYPRWRR